MLRQKLQVYRQERRTFILGLKYYYDIDFYKLDRQERKEWLYLYIKSRREFLGKLVACWEEYPATLDGLCNCKDCPSPSGRVFKRGKRK
jgi:hypothetical protein